MPRTISLLAVLLSATLQPGKAQGDETLLTGTDAWGCRRAHPAVVNPAVPADPETVLSLSGEWGFVAAGYNETRRNSHDWDFYADVVDWTKARRIRVPGVWEAQGVGVPGMAECWDYYNDCNPKPLHHKHVGECWYRRTVKIPAAWRGRRVWLKIGGVNAQGWFWINRRQVAHVANYCATVKYDVTDCVTPGREAEVIVQASNALRSRKGLMNGCHRWGGLYRDLELEATPADVWIDDAWVRGDFDKRLAEVHVEIGKAGGEGHDNLVLRATVESETIQIPINQASDQTNQAILKIPLANFRPWSPEHPNLQTAKVELVSADGAVLQTRCERFGVRKFEVRGKEFYLNGRPFFLRGFGDDHAYPLTGMSPPDRDLHRRHMRMAREAGFNYVRLHTHCEVPEYFDAADETGILIQPEPGYMNGDIPAESVTFDPVGDTLELYRNFRRHPSFAIYSSGNEGSFGPALDKYLYDLVHRLDPDRLKIVMDSQFPKINRPGVSDFEGGPVSEWPRGSVDPARPFVCHEYLNRTVKLDARLENRFTGAWAAPVTRAQRAAFLAEAGLGSDWGDRLQDAQHALQSHWHRTGVEAARADPHCDGFCLWTLVDVVVAQGKTYTAQGVFTPFWEPKRKGSTPGYFARFNSPDVVLFDVADGESVFTSGDAFSADVLFAHYGEGAIGPSATLDWKLVSQGRTLIAGTASAGEQSVGPARLVSTVRFTVPDVSKAVKARLVASVSGCGENDRELWIFPRRPKGDGRDIAVSAALQERMSRLFDGLLSAESASKARLVVAEEGSPLLAAARDRGQCVLRLAPFGRKRGNGPTAWTTGRTLPKEVMEAYKAPSEDVSLGWWSMGHQVGTALKSHPALSGLPHEGVLSPLLFGIIGTGVKLPVAELTSESLIIVGEGGDSCSAYLAEPVRGREIACWGLDLLSGRTEATAILDGALAYLKQGSGCGQSGAETNVAVRCFDD